MFSLEGKSVLVTGGTRGIGKAIVLELAKAGADVAFTYARSAEAAETVKKEVESLGKKALSYQADAADATRAEEVIGDIVKTWGKLDVLVNNAGITKDTLIMRMNEQQWDDVITTNLKSVFNYSKHAVRPFMKAGAGSVINIGSVVGLSGNAGQTNYAASKAGIIGFSKSLAKELASRNIRVNVIAPGYIKTEMTGQLSDKVMDSIKASIPMGEAGDVQDIAAGVIFLASDASRYITGETIRIDGGMAM
ncbi:3-oxoacyl-[acyl-carrier-protein] reductase [Cyclonatronum proteinivorum]|uniref:3-oxoacyl-[acyl-carrier-protein] reductase n=1 Tax=Cyclonatronum proteinivorum TaxID=1457365 RepID=A0A345UM36_9BACT|nr:3-oxoacyl-[acyl-carrier-protein] reductase [Cyclonatronum proteinivorum]AXJ01538.1 3-oxoacyl-[acyl-carrier-protein] reductase [Cyclonatronum proteinivorum]